MYSFLNNSPLTPVVVDNYDDDIPSPVNPHKTCRKRIRLGKIEMVV